MNPQDEIEPPAAAIVYSYGLGTCPGCGHSEHTPVSGAQGDNHPKRVRVINITQVKTGWLAQGDLPSAHCDWCGQVYRELVYYIPIECAAFPCPTCGPDAELTTEILSITEAATGYSFVALLNCNACSRQHRFSKILGGLSRITKVKLGPTGVEVEVKP